MSKTTGVEPAIARPVTREETDVELSIVMPCLNEAKTLRACIEQAQRTLRSHAIAGEIIVADNGSTDGSIDVAAEAGARVVQVARKGYGSALMGGIEAAKGKYVLMADPDASYDFSHAPRFLADLRNGAELVMGNRFRGGIRPGAMRPLHRYIGNPILSFMGRMFFRNQCGDFHCGMRAFSKTAFEKMRLRTTGMEFASEMVVKAALFGMKVTEVPTTLAPDGRGRPPHLRSFRDGWRHLRFLLLYSPRWLFLYPGMALLLLGTITGLWLLPGPRRAFGVTFDVHTMVYASMAVLVGFQSVAFATFTKIFAISEGLLPEDPRLNRLFRYVTLEVGATTGVVLVLLGLLGSIFAVGTWTQSHFGDLRPEQMLRLVIPSALLLTLGVEVVLASFFLSVLGMSRR
jgi:Glycosyl transferase family 2